MRPSKKPAPKLCRLAVKPLGELVNIAKIAPRLNNPVGVSGDLDQQALEIFALGKSQRDGVVGSALQAAAARGLRVPQDVSVAGFDDIDLSRATTPMLTTVRQPLAELGRMAVSLLARLLERHEVQALHVELATELVVRDSTGAAPAR